jgi:nucleoside phosphorylase
VGWICALPVELAVAMAMLDEQHLPLSQHSRDNNCYILGRIGHHNVVVACLPAGLTGTNSAATVASQMSYSFASIRYGLMVGIGGGVPSADHDIRLGDVVVSKPESHSSGVVQYDFGKTVRGGRFIQTGTLNTPPPLLLSALSTMQAKHDYEGYTFASHLSKIPPMMQPKFISPGAEHDILFEAEYDHPGQDATCESCDPSKQVKRPVRDSVNPVVHYGTIASGNEVMRHGISRDRLRREYNVLCFEMEAAGLMNSFPCVVIRGICDYADSHKNKQWQSYAALTAAAYTKELLYSLPAQNIEISTPTAMPPASAAVSSFIPVPVTRYEQSSATCSTESSKPVQLPSGNSAHIMQQAEAQSGKILFSRWFSVFSPRFLNWDEVALGRLVLDLNDPGQDFCHTTIAANRREISVLPFEEIKTILDQQKRSRLPGMFAKLFSGKIDTAKHSVEKIAAIRSITYKLLNSGEFFSRLIEDETTRRWLEKVYKRTRVYLAVSIHSVVGFSVVKGNESDSSGATVFPEIDLATRELAPGDWIIGVQYRKLRFRRANIDTALLEGPCWREYDYDRTRGTQPDVIEVTLDDEFLTDDLKEEYDFETYHSSTGENYLLLVCSSIYGKSNLKENDDEEGNNAY